MDYVELGRRLVACKHFRPMRGMRDVQGRTWDDSLLWRWNSACDVPDLTDPATLGCVLALVRAAWGKPNGVVNYANECGSDPRGWYYCWVSNDGRQGGGIHWYSRTEAEALVAALEAAP